MVQTDLMVTVHGMVQEDVMEMVVKVEEVVMEMEEVVAMDEEEELEALEE